MQTKNNYVPPSQYSNEEKLIWQVLIYRDFIAFYNQDWDLISKDFIEDGFFGIDGKRSKNKMNWSLSYNSLEAYKNDWLLQSKEFNKKIFLTDPLTVLFNTTKLRKIEIIDNIALVHKEFNGVFKVENEEDIVLDWISLFVLRKTNENWKIASFTGYLPK